MVEMRAKLNSDLTEIVDGPRYCPTHSEGVNGTFRDFSDEAKKAAPHYEYPVANWEYDSFRETRSETWGLVNGVVTWTITPRTTADILSDRISQEIENENNRVRNEININYPDWIRARHEDQLAESKPLSKTAEEFAAWITARNNLRDELHARESLINACETEQELDGLKNSWYP